ncbi:MAG TPA: ABC transporter transmembrane domain-containing protein, partial [Vicinamibacterales bacterium]|nr:ABC transporter transmembrane domain-containing protein [Vicinamibacterales bacterium]
GWRHDDGAVRLFDAAVGHDVFVAALIDRDLRRALSFIVPYWRRLLLVVGLSAVSTALSLYLPLLSRDFVDGALLGKSTATLVRVALLFAGASAAGFLINVLSGLRYTRVSADILFDMRLEMYRHLQRLSPRFYARTRMGDIMSRINNDIGEIQRIAAETALAWVGNVLFLAGTMVMLAWLDVRLFAVTIATAPLGLWALVHFRRRFEREVAELRQRSADIGSFLIETLQATRLVVASSAETREVARFGERNASFVRALMSMQVMAYLSGGLPGLIAGAGGGLVFVYGGVRVIHGAMTVGTFVAFMAYQMRFMPPLQALMGMYANLATVRVSLRRVAEILDEPIEIVEAAGAAPLGAVRGDVAFDEVTVTYGRGGPVLERLSFEVRAGETVAIVGPSGSGKSTIADLLLRLIDPDEGRVRIDGRDLRGVPLADLRSRVALVEQEPCILHATLLENIRYARPDASDDEVTAAVRQAALAPFVATLPDGLQTIVGERGTALSAGERQRVAIARALLRQPDVLVLDEPSAALDPESERRIADGYASVMRGRTTIVITHRLDLAARADRVIDLTVPGTVRVAVIDSGVHASHPHVGGVAGGVAIDADGRETDDYVDRLGHGTAVAAAIREKAPDAELYAVRVFDRTLSTGIASLVQAIDWAARAGMHVANLSLGTSTSAHAPILRDAVTRATAAGLIIVSARQDEGVRWLPGSLPDVVPVELDWSCPRDAYRHACVDGVTVFRASGYARPIPGVPPERNLHGISFAVANLSGFVARARADHATLDAVVRALTAC